MMMKMTAVLGVVLLLASRVDLVSSRNNIVVNTPQEAAVDHPTPLELAYAQVDWAVSKGGSFNHKKVIIKPTSLIDNNNNNLGLYAAGEISVGNIIMKIPRSTILSNGTLRYVTLRLVLPFLKCTYWHVCMWLACLPTSFVQCIILCICIVNFFLK
jgi:hypothetical protein